MSHCTHCGNRVSDDATIFERCGLPIVGNEDRRRSARHRALIAGFFALIVVAAGWTVTGAEVDAL